MHLGTNGPELLKAICAVVVGIFLYHENDADIMKTDLFVKSLEILSFYIKRLYETKLLYNIFPLIYIMESLKDVFTRLDH